MRLVNGTPSLSWLPHLTLRGRCPVRQDTSCSIRAYQDLLSGKSDAFYLIDQIHALEKLGVTEGTLAER